MTVANPFSNDFLTSSLGTSYSIVGLYSIVLFTIGNWVRYLYSGYFLRIPYEDGHNVDDLLMFVEGVYIARFKQDLLREEELYRRLLYIYRNPPLLTSLMRRKPPSPPAVTTPAPLPGPVAAAASSSDMKVAVGSVHAGPLPAE